MAHQMMGPSFTRIFSSIFTFKTPACVVAAPPFIFSLDPNGTWFLHSITPFVTQYSFFLSIIIEDHTPTTYTNQTVVLNTLSHSSPPPTYAQAHFTAYGSEFSTNSKKVLYLAEKLTGHYIDWFSSHLICNPGILQNYDLFVNSLLSFSGEDKELSIPSASQFAGLTQGSLPLGKYNQKFCSLQSRLQASDTEACSFYKIGLNRLLQEFLVHHNLSNKLEPLIREVVKWNWKYLSSKTHPPSNLFPAARLFIPDKAPLSSTPPPGTEPKSVGEEETTTSALTVDQRIIFYQPALSPNVPPFINKTSTLTLLSLNNTSKSPTVLVIIHGPLGKIKVLALLDTGANANLIE
ncbi:hypothetical protein DSO57_1011812 [Entomophthora muscae]|uniref:Uncharacterized protein n=1 Tax=Entomophthora muscae TaxID=34485 RepID=A0ACC2UFR5_9FUNG|nr:hypothetical protein DSO57_1011812 [Entomophthora muscae]